jgi:predicted phage terminase large subunit-like protein
VSASKSQVTGPRPARAWNASVEMVRNQAFLRMPPSSGLGSCYLGQTLYVRHAAEMWLELPDLKKRLPELLQAHGYTRASKLYVEPKASGKSVVQELRRISQLNVVEAPSPTGSKLERVNGVAPFIEAGRVVLLDGSWNEAFITQAAGFPTAAHDDLLDCLCQAIARCYDKRPRHSAPPTLIRLSN